MTYLYEIKNTKTGKETTLECFTIIANGVKIEWGMNSDGTIAEWEVIKRIAFGFRSFRRFKARIMICKGLIKIKKIANA